MYKFCDPKNFIYSLFRTFLCIQFSFYLNNGIDLIIQIINNEKIKTIFTN